MTMPGNTALNEVVAVLGTELGNDSNRIIIGSTQSEKDILEKQALIGKRRAVIGFGTGAAISGAVWRILGGGQRRLLGGVTMAGGAMVGVMSGLLSIRHDLFYEILSLPDDRSPFAVQARKILDAKLPNNEFYMEVKERLKTLEQSTGSWDAAPSFPSLREPGDSGSDDGFPGFNSSKSKLPPLPPLPTDDESFDNNNTDATDAAPSSSSPFFFGQSPSRTTPTPQRPVVPPQPTDNSAWGDDSHEDEHNQPKPTSWEEIRRRAASGRS